MSSKKSLFNTFIIAVAALAVAGCVPKATENKAVCGKNQAFDTVTRSCYSIEETRRVPVGTASNASTSEETPKTITLTYTDANKDLAKTCAISGISATSIEVVSPWITDGGIYVTGDLVYQAAYDLATAIPAGAYTALANTAKTALQTAYFKAKASFSQSTISSQLSIVQVQIGLILGYATNYPGDITVQSFYTLTQQRLIPFNAMLLEVNNKCACSGGVCTTTVVPKLGQNGTAGFSYTVTDADGPSLAKAVSVSIAPTALTATHLRPAAESSFVSTFVESDTSLAPATPYTFTVPVANDLSGTTAMQYYFNVSGTGASINGSGQGVTASGGLVTNCMNLSGSSGLTDRTCTYIPASYDTNSAAVAAKATAVVGDLTFTAKSEGLSGNNYSIRYYNITLDNTAVDPYVTKTEKFGMADPTSEAFVRVVGNAIKVFINPGVTTSAQISTLITNHLQAKHLVTVSAGSAALPDPSVVTPAAVTLAGGTDVFDTIPYYASNGTGVSTNAANVMVAMAVTNDIPMVPKTYNSLFSQTETFLEAEVRSVSLGFKDIDSAAGFTFEATVDATSPTCSTIMTNAGFGLLTPHANITVGAIPAPVCVAGSCTVALPLTMVGDFAGSACLYYRVTDSSGAMSTAVQSINLAITNINDIPQLSSVALPTITALGTAQINEDLAPGFNSYFDIYTGTGDPVWEASQLLTVTAVSSNPTLIPNVPCKNYTPVASTPVGSIVPSAVGIYYFDTTNLRCYVSTGTTLATNWKLYPSLTVFPVCAYNYYGQGSPVGVVTPAAANNLYLDTTNNKCYKAASTSSASWAQDATLSNYRLVYIPATDKSGTSNITVNVKDNGGTANAATDNVSDVLALTVNMINDPPVFLSTITSVETNEGGAVQSNGFQIDEDEGSTSDEDAQGIAISAITTDNASVLPVSAIQIFYDLNDNGVEDAGESRTVGTQLEAVKASDVKLHNFYLKLDPVDGVSGNANVILTIADVDDPTSTATTSFSFIVHPIAALHGGWTNISSVGLKTNKSGAPVSTADMQCNYNKLVDTAKCSGGTAACTGTTSPNSTIVPDAANVIYWDSSAQRCYRSTGTTAFSWVDLSTSCPISRTVGSCTDNNCITASSPVATTTPDFVGQYILNSTTNTCYVSTGTTNADWIQYVPAKVTLAWKPFIMVGSGADSAVQIGGWNIYRREPGTDYNFKGGHLKNATSTATFSITDPTVRTFTDTTAVAGKVYFYVVRPVDTIRNFPTYTPEIFSEVRVIASPENYSFVHRWMVNQEMCNGMNITSTTTPHHVDQTENFRCEYSGPGSVNISGTDYYDYGKDLLVDTQEAGCPYAAAPACSANGCIGIGAPVVAASNNDLYYDRGAGKCYVYNGGWSELQLSGALNTTQVNKTNTALNAPLTNITNARASAVCAMRDAPTLSFATIATKAILPTKKDYMAYSSQKLNVTDAEVTEMEQGFSLNIQSRCNGSAASGLDTAFTDSAIPSTSFIYSLPGTYSSGIRSLYTGSIPWGSSKGTDACVSRFGIQDLYGNVAEWVNDGMTCDADVVGYSSKICTAKPSGSFNGAGDFGTTKYAFDNTIGPYAEGGDGIVGYIATAPGGILIGDMTVTVASAASVANFPSTGTIFVDNEQMVYSSIVGTTINILTRGANATTPAAHAVGVAVRASNDDSWLTNWTFADELFGAGNFNYVLGLPITENIDHTAYSAFMDWILAIGPSNGITVSKLHEDGMIVNGSAGASKSFAVGGSYLSGNRAGRFSSELIDDTAARPDVGFRCAVPINTADTANGGDYPTDANYVYPN